VNLFIGSDGYIQLVGDHVETAIFVTNAAGVRTLAAQFTMTPRDLFVWGKRIDDVRAEIQKRSAQAYIKTLPRGGKPRRRKPALKPI
jgi:hypothetical protein